MNIEINWIAFRDSMRRNGNRGMAAKRERTIGGRVNIRSRAAAANVRATDKQWCIAVRVRDFDSHMSPACAGMNDETQSLVLIGLKSARQEGLRGCRPRSDPLGITPIDFGGCLIRRNPQLERNDKKQWPNQGRSQGEASKKNIL